MEYADLQQRLRAAVERYDSQTFLGSFRETTRGSLLNEGLSTRANSLWKMAEYVVAKKDAESPDGASSGYLVGWRTLASNYNNQTLLLEVSDGVWEMYDAQGVKLGGEEYIKDVLENRSLKRQAAQAVLIFADFSDVHQLITYGAPGTGKSHGVDEVAGKLPKEDVVRTTFHPDSDYSTFVGAYKPKMELVPRVAMDGTTVKKATYDAGIDADAKALLEVEKRISYEFVPQAFAKAYVQAWKRMATPGADGKIAPVMLVIEEINRGDCAKIFGDLFQLLDRRVKDDQQDATKKAGFSEYPVLADSDLADFIRRELTDAEKAAITNAGYGTVVAKEHLELMLPPNMYIWATMNTSDQSLFPMDSAFKRRWDWKYTPIKDEGKNWKIQVGGAEYDWWKFLKKVNGIVEDVTSSEDKKLGYFFVKTTDGIVDADMLVNKVFFFLWNDVFKDVAGEACLQYDEDGKQKDIKFHKFFKPDGKLDVAFVNKFLSENLKVPAPDAVPGAVAGGAAAPAVEGAAVEAEPAGEGA